MSAASLTNSVSGMGRRTVSVRRESFAIRGTFTISRGSRTQSEVITVEIGLGDTTGRGECVPYARYGESMDSVVAQIESVRDELSAGADRSDLQSLLPAGAARNAVDCALFDLEAKQAGQPAWRIAGIDRPGPATTAYTLSLGTPEAMAAAARGATGRPLIKLKLGGEGDIERVTAVREALPAARIIVDANEAWAPAQVAPFADAMAGLGVELIEQPLPAAEDDLLAGFDSPVPLCADESCHTRDGLEALKSRYDLINIKLDKTGGLTEALAMAREAQGHGFGIMVGCMLGTSLAMAPAMLVAQAADFVDLDGPLLLAEDRTPALRYEGSQVFPPEPALWG